MRNACTYVPPAKTIWLPAEAAARSNRAVESNNVSFQPLPERESQKLTVAIAPASELRKREHLSLSILCV